MTTGVVEEVTPEAKPVYLETALEVVVLRWPVKERETDPETGRAKRSPSSYIRTKVPLEEKTVVVDRFLSRSRADVYFGIGGRREFSIRTGRCIGLADWVLDKDSLTALRKISRALFGKPEKPSVVSPAPPANEVT
jgi:hypothetical protein